jgi:murein DD-endopeptidase MepM/ murein hydrolase activator NlpD
MGDRPGAPDAQLDVGRVWGEPIHAVHDGVIEWVDRGPNDERGGIFVKIAHRDGTLFSWYFHLAAVPRWVHRGVKVSAGQVIGCSEHGRQAIGTAPHFSLSVKSSKTTHERYLDPEPLIAIWPLWIPGDPERRGRLSITTEPGMPVRNHSKTKRKSTKPAGAAPESVPPSTEATATPQPEPPPTQPTQ